VGSAEHLPLPDGAFAGVLMALTLCFVAEANRALNECHRVVRPGGRLLLGVVPADSAWGRAYIEKSAEGHAVYRHARFRTTAETVELARDAGFELLHAASTLFWMPGEDAEIEPHVEPRIAREAGFAGLLFEKVGRDRSQDARNKGKAIHDDKVDYAVYKPFQQSSPTGSLQTPRTVRAWI
jgi:SAM-dependent methyltransferase